MLMSLKFTQRQAVILMHRLTLDDCISEALTDNPEGCPWTKDEIAARARELSRELEFHLRLTLCTDLDVAILEDVVDGNTWGYGITDMVDDGEISYLEGVKRRRVVGLLNGKLAGWGIKSQIPL